MVVVGRTVHLGDHRVERAGHVRAGVAVGNRIDVQPVQPVGVIANRVAKGADRVAQRSGVQPFQSGHGRELTRQR